MSTPTVNQQSAYHKGRLTEVGDVDADIRAAMLLYLTEDLGMAPARAAERAEREHLRSIPAGVVGDLRAAGIPVEGRDVLDLGAGLGGMSEELVASGARVTALEPGAAWAELTQRRLGRHGRPFTMLQAFGEAIPAQDQSFDLVVSLQVLEHVRDPRAVLSEAWRVLRPGGAFYLACENYLAFFEAHYKVPWLPLLPKPLGALYLRALGRSPAFLNEAVTYTTYPTILRDCREIGFVRQRDEAFRTSLHTKPGAKWQAMRLLSRVTGDAGPLWLDRSRMTFKFGVFELFHKPSGAPAAPAS